MLGSVEASKIEADVDTKKTGGMFLRITQNGEVCTVDASVAKFARAVRTWKSDIISLSPLCLAVICSVSGCCLGVA